MFARLASRLRLAQQPSGLVWLVMWPDTLRAREPRWRDSLEAPHEREGAFVEGSTEVVT